MDAASHRGIDDIREIRERVALAAGRGPLQGLHPGRGPLAHRGRLERAAEDARGAARRTWSSCSARPSRPSCCRRSARAASASRSGGPGRARSSRCSRASARPRGSRRPRPSAPDRPRRRAARSATRLTIARPARDRRAAARSRVEDAVRLLGLVPEQALVDLVDLVAAGRRRASCCGGSTRWPRAARTCTACSTRCSATCACSTCCSTPGRCRRPRPPPPDRVAELQRQAPRCRPPRRCARSTCWRRRCATSATAPTRACRSRSRCSRPRARPRARRRARCWRASSGSSTRSAAPAPARRAAARRARSRRRPPAAPTARSAAPAERRRRPAGRRPRPAGRQARRRRAEAAEPAAAAAAPRRRAPAPPSSRRRGRLERGARRSSPARARGVLSAREPTAVEGASVVVEVSAPLLSSSQRYGRPARRGDRRGARAAARADASWPSSAAARRRRRPTAMARFPRWSCSSSCAADSTRPRRPDELRSPEDDEEVAQMQADMAKAQEALADERVEATAGGGMVKVTAIGQGRHRRDRDRPRGRRPRRRRDAAGHDPGGGQRGLRARPPRCSRSAWAASPAGSAGSGCRALARRGLCSRRRSTTW